MSLRGRRHGGGSQNKLVIVENNLTGGVFDPTITTSVSATLVWICSNGYSTVTTGTSHALSYAAPADGPRTWTVRVNGGLGLIIRLDSDIDVLISIQNLGRVVNLTQLVVTTNQIAKLDIPVSVTYINTGYNSVLSSYNIPPSLTFWANSGTVRPVVTSELPSTLQTFYMAATSKLSGNLSALPSALQICQIFAEPNVTPASVAHLTAIRDFRIYNMGWNETSVDTILLSIANAIVADANTFTYATPALQIGGSGGTANAAPSGTYQAPSGPGGTPVSGLEAVWSMTHNTGHAWTVTATGGTYP